MKCGCWTKIMSWKTLKGLDAAELNGRIRGQVSLCSLIQSTVLYKCTCSNLLKQQQHISYTAKWILFLKNNAWIQKIVPLHHHVWSTTSVWGCLNLPACILFFCCCWDFSGRQFFKDFQDCVPNCILPNTSMQYTYCVKHGSWQGSVVSDCALLFCTYRKWQCFLFFFFLKPPLLLLLPLFKGELQTHSGRLLPIFVSFTWTKHTP